MEKADPAGADRNLYEPETIVAKEPMHTINPNSQPTGQRNDTQTESESDSELALELESKPAQF